MELIPDNIAIINDWNNVRTNYIGAHKDEGITNNFFNQKNTET